MATTKELAYTVSGLACADHRSEMLRVRQAGFGFMGLVGRPLRCIYNEGGTQKPKHATARLCCSCHDHTYFWLPKTCVNNNQGGQFEHVETVEPTLCRTKVGASKARNVRSRRKCRKYSPPFRPKEHMPGCAGLAPWPCHFGISINIKSVESCTL